MLTLANNDVYVDFFGRLKGFSEKFKKWLF